MMYLDINQEHLRTFDVNVSLFTNSKSVNSIEISLKTWLLLNLEIQPLKPETRELIAHLRATEDIDEQDSIKRSLPMILPSVQIIHRKKNTPLEEVLGGYSGYMQFDVDAKGNPTLTVDDMKERITKIPFIQYCGLSSRAKGVWGLVKIENPEKIEAHFDYMASQFNQCNIVLDSKGKNPKDARFLSIDSNAYINPNAPTLSQLISKKPIRPIKHYISANRSVNLQTRIENRLIKICNQKYANGGKEGYHNGRLKAGFLAGGYIAGGVVDEQSIRSSLINSYLSNFTSDSPDVQKKEIKAITDSIESGKSKPIYINLIK